ncbi:1-phosphofructokinase family hexose kinase [Microbacterium xanthum]|uniref:1-phosphofructokinase family hexose kinase n=1 Tax=Microbacterium xanthum TaxID=3079794 RepID=UPI002AD2AC1E|nr:MULTISPECIES: 1-phosphofructokinase [unclassified Microbacterium]MDZ8172291.1 1-phosphofructokinase [Microbacterium sp. KSW-48]MDZ8201991.1 1-phosphofructokinase [Microbacterium sp. SSW1-59]
MIVTVTAHPSLDRAVALDGPLRVGDVQPAAASREDAGGKGVNVARVLRAAGVSTRAVVPVAEGDPFDAALRAGAIEATRVPVAGAARANLTITDPDGVTTKLNLPGAVLSDAERSALVDATVSVCAGADWLVLAGSLPPGAPEDFYVEIIRAVRAAHGQSSPRIAVDTSGAALEAVVRQGYPDLIKPNDEELADLVGSSLEGEDLPRAVREASRSLVPDLVGAALITLGSRGAVLVDADGARFATAPSIRVASTVGAGDSSLAGLLIADVAGRSPEERLLSAIRYGAAAATLPGTLPPTPADLPEVAVTVTVLS